MGIFNNNGFNKFALARPITIGGRSDMAANRHFLGMIKSVQVYGSALSQSEIDCVFAGNEDSFYAVREASSVPAATTSGASTARLGLLAAASAWVGIWLW